VEWQRRAAPLSGVAGAARRDDIPCGVRPMLRQWDDVLHAEATGLNTAVGATIPVRGFDGLPLGEREVIHGSVGESCHSAPLPISPLFSVSSTVLASLRPCTVEPFRILATATVVFLLCTADRLGVLLGMLTLPRLDLRFVSPVAHLLYGHETGLAVRPESVSGVLVSEVLRQRLGLTALRARLDQIAVNIWLWNIPDFGDRSVPHRLEARLAVWSASVLGLVRRIEVGYGLGLSAAAASLHAVIIPQIVAG
jgi:hypothetical protein